MTRNICSIGKAGNAPINARRSAARLAAAQAVYQMITNDQPAKAVIEEFLVRLLGMPVEGQQMIAPDGALFSKIVGGVGARFSALESLVSDAATHGREDRKAGSLKAEPLLYAVLLCGSWELMAELDTDAPVIISEYIGITHAFFDKGEARLVNGILDRVRQFVRDEP